ncbi:YraN family protein [Lysobacter sp. TY2-98]|uniref:YraN family protein n=1 Tax=Lysobacter sp. TY2-98 TaxID=2290922 RepID=UPI000E1FB6D0|nr:YraN family protein [Lysobacter sp. TY2-98]AXK70958.1 YraN family protein [Lysobacter sp. TY2-98]
MTPVASTRSRGARVEAAARDHLVRAGLSPVAANANYRFGELDLVMRDGATLVFVEVRFRADDRFGGGAQSITHAKRRKLVRAASAFLAAHPRWADAPCRFDVVEASGDIERPVLSWLRDAFRADDC